MAGRFSRHQPSKVSVELATERMVGHGEVLDVAHAHRDHAEFVWKTLFRMGVAEADLPDVLQEVFVTVHRRRDSFDGKSMLRTWLYGICRRLVSNHRRKLQRRREDTMAVVPERPDRSGESDPEALLLARHARRRVHKLLEQLDTDRRVVFVMFEVEGEPCPAIAASLGIPLGTVYSRLRSAREDFAAALTRQKAREAGGRR